jgi:hypothetical protein
MYNMNNKGYVLMSAILVTLAGALMRFIPHPINFAPIGAMALFGGMTIRDKKYGLLLPIAALFISDLLFEFFTATPGFYGGVQYFVYGAILLITYLASFVKKATVGNIVLACVWSALLFFVLSNFGVWASGTFYPKTWSGLVACYTAAIPFYSQDFFGNMALNTLWSNLFFSGILFGAFALVKQVIPARNIGRA